MSTEARNTKRIRIDPFTLFMEMQDTYEKNVAQHVELTGDGRACDLYENDCDVETVLAKVMPFDEEKHFSKKLYDMMVRQVGTLYNLRYAEQQLLEQVKASKYMTKNDIYSFFSFDEDRFLSNIRHLDNF